MTPLEYRFFGAAQDDVKGVAQSPFRLRGLKIESRDQSLARLYIGDRLKNRIDSQQRIARKIHLRNQPGHQRRAE